MKPFVEGDHFVHKLLPPELFELQKPTQWRFGGGDEYQTICGLVFLGGVEIVEHEVLEIREVPNQIQDLPARGFGVAESEGFKGWCKVTKVLFNIWYEAGYPETVYLKLPEVAECRKVTKVVLAKVLGSEFKATVRLLNAEPLEEGKQTELVWPFKWFLPRLAISCVPGYEGEMRRNGEAQ